MKPGLIVRVPVFGGGMVERVVLETSEKTVFVCPKEEIDDARREGRVAFGIPYPQDQVEIL